MIRFVVIRVEAGKRTFERAYEVVIAGWKERGVGRLVPRVHAEIDELNGQLVPVGEAGERNVGEFAERLRPLEERLLHPQDVGIGMEQVVEERRGVVLSDISRFAPDRSGHLLHRGSGAERSMEIGDLCR